MTERATPSRGLHVTTPRREGVKGTCKNCGFPIIAQKIPTGREFTGPFWMLAWVHREGTRSCFWVAEPKSHSTPDPTLHDRINAGREAVRLVRDLHTETVASVCVEDGQEWPCNTIRRLNAIRRGTGL